MVIQWMRLASLNNIERQSNKLWIVTLLSISHNRAPESGVFGVHKALGCDRYKIWLCLLFASVDMRENLIDSKQKYRNHFHLRRWGARIVTKVYKKLGYLLVAMTIVIYPKWGINMYQLWKIWWNKWTVNNNEYEFSYAVAVAAAAAPFY